MGCASMKGVGGQVEPVCREVHVTPGANLRSLMHDNQHYRTPVLIR